MCLGGDVKKRVRVYRPLTSGSLVGNLLLVAVAISVAFVLGLSQVSLSVVLINLVVAMVGAGVLAYVGSGWAIALRRPFVARASAHAQGPVVATSRSQLRTKDQRTRSGAEAYMRSGASMPSR